MEKFKSFLENPFYRAILWLVLGVIIFLVGITRPKADTLYNNNGIKFYNNNGTSVNAVTTNYIEQINESSAIITTIAGSYGGLAVVQLSNPLISGHIYTVFLNVGAESGGGETRISSKNCIGIGAWAQQAADNYVNNCVSPKFSNYAPTTSDKGRGVYYTFIANSNNTYIAIPYSTATSCYNCRNYSFGYIINDGGDTNGLTEQQITNIINNQTSNINNSIQSSISQNFENCGENTVKFSARIKGKFYSGSTGQTSSNANYNISQFINVTGGNSYTVNFNDISGLEYGYMCWYNNDNVLSCTQYREMSGYAATNFVVTAPSSANKVSFTYRKGATSEISGNICVNRLDSTTDAINDVNDTLTDDNVDGNSASSFFDDFTVTDNGGISSIITAPLVAINAMLSNQCSPLSGTWRGQTFELPCGTDFWNRMSTIRTWLNVAIGGLLCYRIIIKLFKLIEGFKNPDNDKVEVMNL